MQKEASTRYETTKIEINYDEKHVSESTDRDWGCPAAVCQQLAEAFSA
ncbi:hypothetical protein [Paenibacillus larvae]|nr:hypothetical protein [Paenibacillus larvae]MDT2194847.1 hypothetical protein [Paenibacillus larvae]